MTVPEVLRRAGHTVGRCVNVTADRWRTTCPLHKGDNQEAFSYTKDLWHCFTCNESGGVVGLAERLGVRERPLPRPDLEGMPDSRLIFARDRQRVEELLTIRLARSAAERRKMIQALADTIHRACEQAQASELPRWLDQIALDYQNDPDGQGQAFETAARWWAEVQRWRDVAHTLYALVGFDPERAELFPLQACVFAEDARHCGCGEADWPPRGSRVRPRLA